MIWLTQYGFQTIFGLKHLKHLQLPDKLLIKKNFWQLINSLQYYLYFSCGK